MDKIILLNRQELSYEEKTYPNGTHDEFWNPLEPVIVSTTFKADVFPVGGRSTSAYESQLLQNGDIQTDSKRIYTKFDLTDIIDKTFKYKGKNYQVYQGQPFDDTADLRVYYLNRKVV